jgi:prepilin-type N-terminal cleavage/methylation domain-containing protein
MRRRNGFTLIELIVVITIMVVLIGLLTVFISGTIDRAKYAKTHATVRMLDEGCQTYHVSFGEFPPYTPDPVRCLHRTLGSRRIIPTQYSATGTTPNTNQPPVIEFRTDVLRLNPGEVPNPASPVAVVDAWDNDIRYLRPGTKNTKAVDIWSYGKDGLDNSSGAPPVDDVSNYQKDF